MNHYTRSVPRSARVPCPRLRGHAVPQASSLQALVSPTGRPVTPRLRDREGALEEARLTRTRGVLDHAPLVVSFREAAQVDRLGEGVRGRRGSRARTIASPPNIPASSNAVDRKTAAESYTILPT